MVESCDDGKTSSMATHPESCVFAPQTADQNFFSLLHLIGLFYKENISPQHESRKRLSVIFSFFVFSSFTNFLLT